MSSLVGDQAKKPDEFTHADSFPWVCSAFSLEFIRWIRGLYKFDVEYPPKIVPTELEGIALNQNEMVEASLIRLRLVAVGTATEPVPSKYKAEPDMPLAYVAPPDSVPLLPYPDESYAVVPDPSSKLRWRTHPSDKLAPAVPLVIIRQTNASNTVTIIDRLLSFRIIGLLCRIF